MTLQVSRMGATIDSMVTGVELMAVLVIGRAGYIGSHTTRLLMQEEYDVWIYGSLSAGHRAALPDGRCFCAASKPSPLVPRDPPGGRVKRIILTCVDTNARREGYEYVFDLGGHQCAAGGSRDWS